MADGGSGGEDPLFENPLYGDLHGAVRQILRGVFSRPKSDVIEEIVTEISSEVIEHSREILFDIAKGVYMDQLEAAGLQKGTVKLELKHRRQGNNNAKEVAEARDIVDMVLYTCKCTVNFPRDVLNSNSTYIDVENRSKANSENNGQQGEKPPSSEELVTLVYGLMDRCTKQERAIGKLWEYIFSMEKLNNESLSSLKNDILRVNGLIVGKQSLNTHGPVAQTLDSQQTKCQATNTYSHSTVDDHNMASTGINVGVSDTNNVDISGDLSSGQRNQAAGSNGGPNPGLTGGHSPGSSDDIVQQPDLFEHTASPITILIAPTYEKLNVKGDNVKRQAVISDIKPSSSHQSSVKSAKDDYPVLPSIIAKKGPTPYIIRHPVHSTPTPNSRDQLKSNGDIQANNDAGWQQPRYMRKQDARTRSHENRESDNAPQSDTSLTGITQEESVDIYVQHIKRKVGDTLKDISDKVRKYCQSKGVRVMNARTITNKFCEDSVGCRITVPLRQKDKVFNGGIWPPNIVCRPWERSGRQQNRPDNRASSGNDEDPDALTAAHGSRSRTRGAPGQRNQSQNRRSTSRQGRNGRSSSRNRSRSRQSQAHRSTSRQRHRSTSRQRQPRHPHSDDEKYVLADNGDREWWWNQTDDRGDNYGGQYRRENQKF